jgi:hypothetical protein
VRMPHRERDPPVLSLFVQTFEAEDELMAKAVVTHVTDDIDGSPDAQPVTFGLGGVAYAIDLSQKNLDKLTKAFEPFIAHAERRGKPRLGNMRKSTAPTERPYDIADVRSWAANQQITLPRRGRIPRSIIDQYLATRKR